MMQWWADYSTSMAEWQQILQRPELHYCASVRVRVLYLNASGTKVFILSKTKLHDLVSMSVNSRQCVIIWCSSWTLRHYCRNVLAQRPKCVNLWSELSRHYDRNVLMPNCPNSVPKCVRTLWHCSKVSRTWTVLGLICRKPLLLLIADNWHL